MLYDVKYMMHRGLWLYNASIVSDDGKSADYLNLNEH